MISLFRRRSASVDATVDTTLSEFDARDDFGDHLSKSKNAAMAILAEMAEAFARRTGCCRSVPRATS